RHPGQGTVNGPIRAPATVIVDDRAATGYVPTPVIPAQETVSKPLGEDVVRMAYRTLAGDARGGSPRPRARFPASVSAGRLEPVEKAPDPGLRLHSMQVPAPLGASAAPPGDTSPLAG